MGFKLDIRDYHSLFMINSRVNDEANLTVLFNDMYHLDYVKPDTVSFNFLMRTYLQSGNLEALVEAFNECGIFD
jgi:Pentatricopeptide repeat domain